MIIKKNYGEDYIIMKVTNIETNKTGTYTNLIGQLIDEKVALILENSKN